jgi:acetyl esterase/lipase
MKKLLLSFAVLLCIAAFSQDTPVVKVIKFPSGYQAKIDEVYHEINGWKGREDIYFNPTATEPTPVIFNIHGGGWNKGTKEAQGGFDMYFKMGFAVVNVEYRLSQQATAPAAVEDVRAAMLYVVKNAKEFNIDVNKIVIMGGSAGGHLALMCGLLQHDNKFDGEYKKVKKFTIAAIINKYGITDVWDWAYGAIKKSKSATMWLGNKANDESFAKSVSPIYYVNKNSPPTFIVHGNADPVVPYQQSVDLKKKFDEVGAISEFKTIEGGLHGKFSKEQNTEVNEAIKEFLLKLNIPKNKSSGGVKASNEAE